MVAFKFELPEVHYICSVLFWWQCLYSQCLLVVFHFALIQWTAASCLYHRCVLCQYWSRERDNDIDTAVMRLTAKSTRYNIYTVYGCHDCRNHCVQIYLVQSKHTLWIFKRQQALVSRCMHTLGHSFTWLIDQSISQSINHANKCNQTSP